MSMRANFSFADLHLKVEHWVSRFFTLRQNANEKEKAIESDAFDEEHRRNVQKQHPPVIRQTAGV